MGQKKGTLNGALVNGTKDYNLRSNSWWLLFDPYLNRAPQNRGGFLLGCPPSIPGGKDPSLAKKRSYGVITPRRTELGEVELVGFLCAHSNYPKQGSPKSKEAPE